jgi:hypothetical protein
MQSPSALLFLFLIVPISVGLLWLAHLCTRAQFRLTEIFGHVAYWAIVFGLVAWLWHARS